MDLGFSQRKVSITQPTLAQQPNRIELPVHLHSIMVLES